VSLQSFFSRLVAIFSPPSAGASYRERRASLRVVGTRPWVGSLMYDLAALGIAAACFAFVYLILWVLDRV